MLVVVGITALLDEYHVISYSHSWPLYLIVLGVLSLAERAALAQMPPPQYPYQQPWPPSSGPYPPGGYSAAAPAPGPSGQPSSWTSTSTAIVRSQDEESK
nr:DUF5668 domain-containing protein [Paracidobacterium acidisoli]